MSLVKVVMLTSMAGESLQLTHDDVYETDLTEAKRFIEHRAAREFDPKTDSNKPVKRKPEYDAGLEAGHYQAEPTTKAKKRRTGQSTETNDANSEANDRSETSEAASDANEAGTASELASSELTDQLVSESVTEEKPAVNPVSRPRRR